MNTVLVSPIGPLIALLTLAPHATAQVAAAGVTGSRDGAKATVATYKVQGHYPLAHLLRLTIADGMISAEVTADIPADQVVPVRVEVEDSGATWVVRKRIAGAAAAAGASPYVMVTRYDFDAPADAPWQTMVTTRGDYIAVYAVSGELANGMRVRLTQSAGTLSFSCVNIRQGAQQTFFNASANSFRQLQAEHPDEVRRYLTPMFRSLTGRVLLRPGAGDVYRVFDTIPADPQVARKVDALLDKLEADAFAVRDRASKELAALGAPAVLAALRCDVSDFSGEAKNRIDLFVAAHANMDPRDVPKAKADGSFLLDCMDDDDPAVRAAAKAALQELLGKPVEFDLALTGEPRSAAVDALRKKLDSVIRPTTRRAR